MRFLISIHDVWPGNYPLVAGYLNRLRSLGVHQFALLIVPFYHGVKKIGEDPHFLDWLKEEASRGTEIFLHGYYHQISERIPGASLEAGRSAYGRWINRNWANEEAEFCGLSPSDSLYLLQRGATALRESHLPCLGFVAPTWHGAPSLGCLSEQKFKLLETRFFIKNLKTGIQKFAPPLAWNQGQNQKPSLAGGRAWLQVLLRLGLIKVALHPGDFEGSETLQILEKVFESGNNISYQDIFITSA